MDVLIDTNVLIWLDRRSRKLSSKAQGLVEDRRNILIVSAASAWEIAAKQRKGKLTGDVSASTFVATYEARELPVTLADGEFAGALEWSNPDPFDRMILAQAERRGLILITGDRAMFNYPAVATVAAI